MTAGVGWLSASKQGNATAAAVAFLAFWGAKRARPKA
jgi:hypothetical protein